MKVALVQWTNPDYYQAVINTAQILSEHGYQVEILCRATGETFFGTVDYGSSTKVIRIGSKNRFYLFIITDFLRYLVMTMCIGWKTKYDWIIGYDLWGFAAAFLMTRLTPSARLVYHNFDLSAEKDLGLLGRQIKRLERAGARKARAVIFPSIGRAELFKKEVGLRKEPLIVMNCQRILPPYQRTGHFQKILSDHGLIGQRIILRVGSLGPGHAIEMTICSMKYWKESWGLVFAGITLDKRYLASMQDLVSHLGLTRQVLFLPNVSYDLWNDCLCSADVGLALYEDVNINHQHMAGAGQKLFFYVKAGIPVVVSAFPDFKKLIDRYQLGAIAESTDPEAIGRAINSVLCDRNHYTYLKINARSAFCKEFNFDTQFDPLLNILEARIPSNLKPNQSKP